MHPDGHLTQYNPVYEFHSERAEVTLELSDDYKVREEILNTLYRSAELWFELALSRAPVELQSTLQVCTFNSDLRTSATFSFSRNISP